MKSPQEIDVTGPTPLMGKLKQAEQEVIAAAMVKAAQKKNVWDKIRVEEISGYLNSNPVYQLNPRSCAVALSEMKDDGLIIVEQDSQGLYMKVTEKLINLVA